MADRRAQIEARLAAATPGPWEARHDPDDPHGTPVYDAQGRALCASPGEYVIRERLT